MTSAPTVASMPAVPAPTPDSESPTITTGRRMGEAVAKAAASDAAASGASAPPSPGRKKKVSPLVIGGGLLAAAIVLGALSLSKKSDTGLDGASPAPTAAPASTGGLTAPAALAPTALAASAEATPVRPPSAPSPLSALPPATAKPPAKIAGVETPAPETAPTKRARVKPTTAPLEEPAGPSVQATPKVVKPAQQAADLTVTVRRFLKIDVSPNQARVYLDGRYIGISDDWDDSGGGSLLAFNLEGTHRLRICAPEHRDLIVDLIVRSTATDDKVSIDRSLEKGTPDGPTGPEGKLKRPNYRTVGAAVFNVDPPDTMVTVNGREQGLASKKDFHFPEMAVYEVLLTAPGYEPKALRVLVGPTAGEVRANIKEKLKKM